LETEFGGLFLEVEDAAVWSGGGLLEGFHFAVGHAAGDDRVEDAGEFVGGGGDGFGGTESGLHLAEEVTEGALVALEAQPCARRRRCG